MPFSIPIEEIIHLRTAGGKKKIVRPYIIREDPEHWTIQICIQCIAHIQFLRFVAVKRNCRGKKFLSVCGRHRKEVCHLSARRIRDSNALPCFYIHAFHRTGGNIVFHENTTAFFVLLLPVKSTASASRTDMQ